MCSNRRYFVEQAPWHIEDTAPSEDWPNEGAVTMEGYSTRYRPNLDLVLKDVNMDIRPNEKVGLTESQTEV